jgi:hypothetical protein
MPSGRCPPADPATGDPPPDRCRLRLYRHGPLRQARRRTRHGPAQGACTATSRAIRRIPTADLLAFGISAIGKVGPTYSQNVKTLDEYYDLLDSGTLPVFRGIELNADDLLRRSDHPGADVPLRTVDRVDRDRPPDRLQVLLRRGARRPARNGKGRPGDASTTSGSPFCHAAACWCARSPWSSTATCAPTASAPATRRSSEDHSAMRQPAPSPVRWAKPAWPCPVSCRCAAPSTCSPT